MKKYGILVLGGIVGAFAGYLYYYFIGCNSGTCPLTSNPYYSTILGLIFGLILFFPNKKGSNSDNKKDHN